MNALTAATAARVGLRIRQARKQAGLSHDTLAERIRGEKRNPRIRATRQHLIKLEKGQHLPRPEMLQAIADATGKRVEFFSSDEDEEESDAVSDLMQAIRRVVRQEMAVR